MKLYEQIGMAVIFGLALMPAIGSFALAIGLRRRSAHKGTSQSTTSKVGVLLLVLASCLPSIVLTVCMMEPSGVVVYDDLHLTGSGRFLGGGAYDHLVVGTSSTSLWALSDDELTPDDVIPIPDVYVRLPDGKTILLREITPSKASEYWERLAPRDTAKYPRVSFQGRYGAALECHLVFDDDQLIAAELIGGGFAVSTKPRGPFYPIPFSYSQMIDLFGEPRTIYQRHWAI